MDLPATLPTSQDTLWGGAVVFTQPARGRGYRYNLDPVLLHGFVPPSRHLIELGAGVGVLSVLLLKRDHAERVTAVELQPALAAMCQSNARDNGLGERLHVLQGDLRHLELPSVDAVAFNPPYFRANEGNAAPDLGRDLARRERAATLRDFAQAARRAVAQGFVSAIVPARRSGELASLFEEVGARHVVRRFVQPRQGDTPNLALVRAELDRNATPGRAVHESLPVLIVHKDAAGSFTDEVQELLTPPKGGELLPPLPPSPEV